MAEVGYGRSTVRALLTFYRPLEYGHGRQRAVVHFDDLTRLDEEEFMNDSLIDFYMMYVTLYGRDTQRLIPSSYLFQKWEVPSDKVYFFNTYFFTALTKNTGRQTMNYKAVERWTSKIDIFGYDYIIVPINEAYVGPFLLLWRLLTSTQDPLVSGNHLQCFKHRSQTGDRRLQR